MYEIGKRYEFEIISFKSKINSSGLLENYISLQVTNNFIYDIKASNWQIESLWKYNTLDCEVIDIQEGYKIKLKNVDKRHPIFKIESIYDFKIFQYEECTLNSGKTFDLIILEGEDGLVYEVSSFPGQKLIDKKGTVIKCAVKDILFNKVILSQTEQKDYFFNTFIEITNNADFEKKYFKNLLIQQDNKGSYSTNLKKLNNQYEFKRSFWVLTYSHLIIPQLFNVEIIKFEYKKALEINSILLKFENYILKSGIIRAFKSEEDKNKTLNKTKGIIEDSIIIDKILNNIILDPYNPFDKISKTNKNVFKELYFTTIFSNFEVINFSNFFEKFNEIVLSELFEESHLNLLDEFLKNIIKNKNKFFKSKREESFNLSPSNLFSKSLSKTEIAFLQWTYCEILINEKLGNYIKRNKLIGKTLKLFLKDTINNNEKEKLIISAYYYLINSNQNNLPNPFYFKEEEIKVNKEIVEKIFNLFETDKQKTIVDELINLKNDVFKVQLTRKISAGFFVNFKGLFGFLPQIQIQNKNLRNLIPNEYNFEIEVECLNVSKKFRFFLVKQINEAYEEIESNNLEFSYQAVNEFLITKVGPNGLYVSVINSNNWGFVHIKNLFEEKSFENISLSRYFQKGELIKLSFESANNNINYFSLLALKKLDPGYYNMLLSKKTDNLNVEESLLVINYDLDSEDDFGFDLEKIQFDLATCLEQYSWIQSNISDKIDNLNIAKQFYINKSIGRGYLIDMFIKYFEILLEIQNCLKSRDINYIKVIREKSEIVISEINQKTLEEYPESERLIYFLDIISLFNKTDEITIETLYNNYRKYLNNNYNKDLLTIAKLTLANNLILSESNEDNFDFSIKNLKSILNYLINGLFNLNETIDDKEYQDLILMIEGDECETVEFKSSIFAPIDMLGNKSHFNNDLEAAKKKNGITHSAMKTIVAFANTNGGTLLIGVNDSKKILGLKNDYSLFNKKDKERDEFGKKFDETIKNYLTQRFISLITKKYVSTPEGDVLRVDVSISSSPVFLMKDANYQDNPQLYVRGLSSSNMLTGYDLSNFITQKQNNK